ncbi:MAG: glutamate 5-kinase, partial [Actinomycetes bacterium]
MAAIPRAAGMVVVKVGTSSITDASGALVPSSIERLCRQVADLRARGLPVLVVTSGAISAGLPVLGLVEPRPRDPALLQAVSAVGQGRLFSAYERALAALGLIAGQVLLAPLDFVHRQQYLHARQTLSLLLDLGVVPVINENDAIADDEIRFGDNDRLAALVAHLMSADLLILLTDTAGLYTGDPRRDAQASLIEEIVEVDKQIEALAGGTGTGRGSGGMASK